MGLTVLLTIHGIGFQQFPDDTANPKVAGYADGLHTKLVGVLGGSVLGPDPNRLADGIRGPVYVQSHFPADQPNNREGGLARLGTLRNDGTVDVTGQPLAPDDARAAHVALVYVHSETTTPLPGATAEMVARGIFEVSHYATVRGAIGMLVHDIGGMIHHGPSPTDPGGQGELKVRDDVAAGHHPLVRVLQAVTPTRAPQGSGPLDVIRTVEDDVAAYVCRNDLRQRVRDFVQGALIRLALRPDVDSIIVNAHSQGTVVSFDVVRGVEPDVAGKIRWLVTAGSPLRKYAQMLAWGTDTGSIALIPQWLNAWDELDPVADPLGPDQSWKRGDPLTAQTPQGLFRSVDWVAGTDTPAQVVDCQVDNVKIVPGTGLRAHDYWGDVPQFVTPLAAVIENVSSGRRQMTADQFSQKFGPIP